MNKYINGIITNAEVIEELLKIEKQIKKARSLSISFFLFSSFDKPLRYSKLAKSSGENEIKQLAVPLINRQRFFLSEVGTSSIFQETNKTEVLSSFQPNVLNTQNVLEYHQYKARNSCFETSLHVRLFLLLCLILT